MTAYALPVFGLPIALALMAIGIGLFELRRVKKLAAAASSEAGSETSSFAGRYWSAAIAKAMSNTAAGHASGQILCSMIQNGVFTYSPIGRTKKPTPVHEPEVRKKRIPPAR